MSFYDFDTELLNENFTPPTKRKPIFLAWGSTLLSGIHWLSDLFFGDYVNGNTDTKVQNYSAATAFVAGDLVYYEVDGFIYGCDFPSTGNLPTNPLYFSLKPFVVGDRIRHVNKSVYECILDNPNGIAPISTTYWIKIQDEFIGLIERTKTNSQILLFEYLLNKWFDTSYNYPSTTNDIYITNLATGDESFIYGVDESESSAVAVSDAEQENYIGADIFIGTVNFTINIPLAVYDALKPSDPSGTTQDKDNIVRIFADNYNCSGITYTITPY